MGEGSNIIGKGKGEGKGKGKGKVIPLQT